MDAKAVMDLISVRRAELEKILASGKSLLSKDVLNKSEELDRAILMFMPVGQVNPAVINSE